MIIEHELVVDYSAQQMFDLVANYQAYPEFIKYCTSTTTEQTAENQVCAQLEMSISGIKQKFSTYTTFFPHQKITMTLAEGPFNHLEGFWEFTELEAGKSKISLYIDYELIKVLQLLFASKFKSAMLNMVESFLLRAQQVYGVSSCV